VFGKTIDLRSGRGYWLNGVSGALHRSEARS
jgi:hypothetical protein